MLVWRISREITLLIHPFYRPWRVKLRGEFPDGWRDKIKLADGRTVRVYPRPIMRYALLGPFELRRIREVPES